MKWSKYYEEGLYSRLRFEREISGILCEHNRRLDALELYIKGAIGSAGLAAGLDYLQYQYSGYVLNGYKGRSLFGDLSGFGYKGRSLFGDLFGFEL